MSGKRNGRSSRICGRDFSGADGSCLCRYDPVSDISRERIAVVDVAAVKAAPEPFHALGRGPMVEAFRKDVTLARSEEHTFELQSLMRISYAVFRLKKKHTTYTN